MQGIYKGFYKYDKAVNQEAIGFGKTYFTLIISGVKDNKFSGTVEDDVFTGGMHGIGTINGEVNGNNISFTKQMPKSMSIVFDRSGTGKRKELSHRKHPTIFYTGHEIKNGKFAGTWKIKPGISVGILWFIMGMKTTGTWEMTKAD
jgi:hypothetical protein